MKKNIHPKYFNNAVFQCACGNKFIAGATVEKMNLEVCSNCHPFFTGKGKLIDAGGRVERFHSKFSKPEPVKHRPAEAKKIHTETTKEEAKESAKKPKTKKTGKK